MATERIKKEMGEPGDESERGYNSINPLRASTLMMRAAQNAATWAMKM